MTEVNVIQIYINRWQECEGQIKQEKDCQAKIKLVHLTDA